VTEDAHPQEIEGTTSSPAEQAQAAAPGGDRGPARSTDTDEGLEAHYHPPQMFKETLEADPVIGGSGSIDKEQWPEDDDGPFGEG
jgi:hypothetical protein